MSQQIVYEDQTSQLVALIFAILFALILVMPTVTALFSLRKAGLEALPTAVWVLIVICFPVVGPLAYFIVRPHAGSGSTT